MGYTPEPCCLLMLPSYVRSIVYLTGFNIQMQILSGYWLLRTDPSYSMPKPPMHEVCQFWQSTFHFHAHTFTNHDPPQ